MDNAVHDSRDGAEFGGLALKDAVIGGLMRVAGKVDTGSREDDGRRDQDSGAKQVAEDDFQAAISPRLGLERMRFAPGRWSGGHQIFPHNPW
jgi:hypothetical protein